MDIVSYWKLWLVLQENELKLLRLEMCYIHFMTGQYKLYTHDTVMTAEFLFFIK